MLYRSYPLANTKGATSFCWDAVEHLVIPSLEDGNHDKDWFRIAVLDCNVKTENGEHRLIGSLVKTVAELSSLTTTLPIHRGTKVKGFLTVNRFEIETPEFTAKLL